MTRSILMLLLALQGQMYSMPAQAAVDHSGWDDLLHKHVASISGGQGTQVDYAGFALDRSKLNRYLSTTSGVTRAEFDAWNRPGQLAFLVNAYNAWTVELILTAYPELTSIKDLGSVFQSPWNRRFIPLLGETRSLDDIEHILIRGSGRYNDPRIHFAVNCASIGCPALRPEAYLPERLEDQFEDAATLFLSDRGRNRRDGDSLEVSSIFKWYREDFENGWRGADRLEAFFLLYKEPLGLDDAAASRLASGGFAIEFLDYDWRLNATAGTKQ